MPGVVAAAGWCCWAPGVVDRDVQEHIGEFRDAVAPNVQPGLFWAGELGHEHLPLCKATSLLNDASELIRQFIVPVNAERAAWAFDSVVPVGGQGHLAECVACLSVSESAWGARTRAP